jgi:hypothetical protein
MDPTVMALSCGATFIGNSAIVSLYVRGGPRLPGTQTRSP